MKSNSNFNIFINRMTYIFRDIPKNDVRKRWKISIYLLTAAVVFLFLVLDNKAVEVKSKIKLESVFNQREKKDTYSIKKHTSNLCDN